MTTPLLRRLDESDAVPIARQYAWIEALLLGAILLLAITIRFYRLGEWSFWPDEVFSLGTKSDGFNESLLRRSLATDLIQYVVSILGPSEWNARLAPAMIGSLSIPLLYFPLRRSLARPGALMVAALLAVSLWHVYWSQSARFYTLLFLFFNLGLLLFYLGLEEDRPWFMLAALVLFGLAARERMAALLGMPALVLYLVVLVAARYERPRGLNGRNLALFFGPALLAGFVFVWPYLLNWQGWMRGFGRLNNSPLFLLAGTLYYVGIPLAAFAGVSAMLLARQRSRFVLLLILSAATPLVLIMGMSLFQYTANRYVFFALFSWLALAGVGLQEIVTRLPDGSRRLALAISAALLAASMADLFLYFTQQNGNRPDWRGALTYIAEHGRAGDRVVSSDLDVFQYYLGEPFVYRTWDAPAPPPGVRTWYIEDLVVDELYPQQLNFVQGQAEPRANYDVHLPWRIFPMRVYMVDSQ